VFSLAGSTPAETDGVRLEVSTLVPATGRVRIGASAAWSSLPYRLARSTMTGGGSLTHPSDTPADPGLVHKHNVYGYTRVPGGPDLLWSSPVASSDGLLVMRHRTSSSTETTLHRTPAGSHVPISSVRNSTNGSDFGISRVRIAVHPDSTIGSSRSDQDDTDDLQVRIRDGLHTLPESVHEER